ncbi:MAG TPA: aromatic amino acid hydroxylase [Polyangiaceae bacterium]
MESAATVERVPPHLRHLIVQQDYSRYTAVDQAVWRFVLLQTHARLKASAHAAYSDGLGQTGISVERIPHIAEMDERLAPFGWGAVCVDGFIPPRAFQELQSLSILPIAAEMRSADHLVYTPAPDIIHEAAGHAPILPEPIYAHYLRRIGAAGARAFTLPEDAAVDHAIHALSEVKENPAASAALVARVEQALVEARAGLTRVSEAARLSRLYWWTAEYGLVGSPRDYKLYGAGLLSSLWESFACHDPKLPKLMLDAAVVDVDYDVTRPQPQLFVTPSFEALHEVLDQVVRELPSAKGGEAALAEAVLAQEVATIRLSSGLSLYGCLTRRLVSAGRSTLLVMDGGRAELGGVTLAGSPLVAVLGDHRSLRPRLRARQQVVLELAGGVTLRGELSRVIPGADGAALLELESGELLAGSELQLRLSAGSLVVLADAALGAHAGAPSDFYPATELPETRVPRGGSIPPRQGAMLALYETALGALRGSAGSDIVPVFERLHRQLEQDFEDDWLLRWNLLESLLKLGERGELSAQLERELQRLEVHYEHRQPIASGLGYLASRVG